MDSGMPPVRWEFSAWQATVWGLPVNEGGRGPSYRDQSGGGPPHSKTLARGVVRPVKATRLDARRPAKPLRESDGVGWQAAARRGLRALPTRGSGQAFGDSHHQALNRGRAPGSRRSAHVLGFHPAPTKAAEGRRSPRRWRAVACARCRRCGWMRGGQAKALGESDGVGWQAAARRGLRALPTRGSGQAFGDSRHQALNCGRAPGTLRFAQGSGSIRPRPKRRRAAAVQDADARRHAPGTGGALGSAVANPLGVGRQRAWTFARPVMVRGRWLVVFGQLGLTTR